MTDEDMTHPARTLPEKQRIDYLLVVAAVAYADRQIAEPERENLRDLCAALGLERADAERVVSTMVAPHEKQLHRILDEFRKADLRFSLLADATVLAFADGQVATGEADQIARFAAALGIDTAQACLIGRYVEEVVQGRETETLSHELSRGLADAAKHLPQRSAIRRLFDRIRGK